MAILRSIKIESSSKLKKKHAFLKKNIFCEKKTEKKTYFVKKNVFYHRKKKQRLKKTFFFLTLSWIMIKYYIIMFKIVI